MRGNYKHWNAELGMYLGCQGDDRDLVDYNQFIKVELIKYPDDDFWIARVDNSQGIPFDVAIITSPRETIFDVDVNMEEGWSQTQDPFEFGIFYMWHPQYNSWIDGFREWPVSGGIDNVLHAFPTNICPDHYGAWINLSYDPRYWAAGSGGDICNSIMFPGSILYIPLVTKD